MDTLTLAAVAIWIDQKNQTDRLQKALERVEQALPVTTHLEPEKSDSPDGFSLLNKAAAEEVTRDCGHSNCTDFGSSDILYG